MAEAMSRLEREVPRWSVCEQRAAEKRREVGSITSTVICQQIISAFRSFDSVVEACYGKKLHPGFQKKIAVFAMDYLKLGISVTPKVHAVLFHVAEFCLLTGQGLCPWSEQAGESVHHHFKQTWKNYKVNDVERDIYADNLLRAVAAYNSKHL